jgi:hypothetical protein
MEAEVESELYLRILNKIMVVKVMPKLKATLNELHEPFRQMSEMD